MRVKLDENLSVTLKPALQGLGHDVLTVADERLLSQPDHVVAEAARSESRVILTLDLDFADLRRFAPGSHPGIVLFRPASLGPLAVNRFIVAFMGRRDLPALDGCTVIVEPHRVRVRRPDPDA